MIAAWADIGDAFTAGDIAVLEGESWATTVTGVVSKINVGYFWMLVNCLTSAAYVSMSAMLRDDDEKFTRRSTGVVHAQTNQNHWVLRLGLDVLQ